MTNSWDSYFLVIARHVAARSKDRSTKVGCVIVGPDNEIRSTGYNSFPRGIDDTREERHERPEKYLWTEHAERNAIYNAARVGTPLKGCRAFLPWFPCMDCARAIVQAGIVEVIGVKPDLTDPKWGADFQRAAILFEEAGVAVRFI
jgi:dCMP deaminase